MRPVVRYRVCGRGEVMAGGCSSITRLSPLSSLSRPWSPELAVGSRESEEGILN